MDSVRLGRALGVGARAAAKTLVTAVDAATSPNPSKASTQQATARPQAASKPQAARPAQTTARSVNDAIGQVTRVAEQVKHTSEGLNRGGKQLSQSVWSPLKRLSGVLWLEFTGVFFGLFAFSAATAAWKLRGAVHETAANHDARVRLMMATAMALVFTYFCVSSFVRAKRKERGR